MVINLSIFAELGNFNKSEQECETDLDKVMYLLKNLGSMQGQPQGFEQKYFTDILDACEIAGFNEDKRTKYDKDMYDERRRNSELETAIEIGEARGFKYIV